MTKDNITIENSAFKLPARLSSVGSSLEETDTISNNAGINNSMPLNKNFNQS